MTHSSRLNYKAKLERLQAQQSESLEQAKESLRIQEDANIVARQTYEKTHKLVLGLAEQTLLLIRTLDDNAYCEGVTFSRTSRDVDASLTNMNVDVMLRRSRDVCKRAIERIALTSEAYNTTKRQLDELLTETIMLKSPMKRTQETYLSTYGIGPKPTDAEKNAFAVEGEISRYNIQYLTDQDSDYESDSESDEEETVARTDSSTIILRGR